ncbi:c-type cytochrome [Sphingomonas nostoxanthinifaciens]|uniref:c-type cytochrome n=1 Tax=Sphingomonas nostoxanthinifaciens TaxID=2872652 RepID=UPI001CC1D3DB|nr:cytochrome c family protein [Sphingomonas nostoxanthinifaciens]UAK23925.1 cytochrome c family protein [Sphingomonas nostoxanthinifaciens]
MDDRANTIAGWVLFAGIAALGLTIVTGEFYMAERPKTMGYTVTGVEAEAGAGAGAAAAEKPFPFYMAQADAAKGGDVFKKCTACHNADKGGANALGPNLYGIVGDEVASGRGGFAFSDALKSKGGKWDFDRLGEWLTSPKAFAPGTKMTFAGLSNPQDRANVIAYLNQQGDTKLPLPPMPSAGADSPAKAAAETKDDAQKAKNQPVQTEAQAAKQPKGNVAGEAAPATSGRADQRRQ